MWRFALVLALGYPDPVLDLDGFRNPDGTVTLTWTLPADPTVVGVTVLRQRLAAWDEDVFELAGPVVTFHDVTAHEDRSYGYWVFTRDATGDLSPGEYVEAWSDTHHEDIDHWCYSSAAASPAPLWAVFAALALLGITFLRRAPTPPADPSRSGAA